MNIALHSRNRDSLHRSAVSIIGRGNLSGGEHHVHADVCGVWRSNYSRSHSYGERLMCFKHGLVPLSNCFPGRAEKRLEHKRTSLRFGGREEEGQRERRMSERIWVGVFIARFSASNIYLFLPILLLPAPWRVLSRIFYTFCTGHFQIFSGGRSEKSRRFTVYSDRNWPGAFEIPRSIRLQWNVDNSNLDKYNFNSIMNDIIV